MTDMTRVPLRTDALAGLVLAAAMCLLGPPIAAALWRRRTGAPWSAFLLGAGVFFVVQIVLRLPMQVALASAVRSRPALGPAFLVSSAATAGLFEEVGRWLGYRWLVRRDASRDAAVMAGLGHGGIEAMLLVGLGLAGKAVSWVLASRGALPEVAAAAVAKSVAPLGFWSAQLGAVERVSAIATQVAFALVIRLAVLRSRSRWLALAIGLHAGVDLVAVLAARRLGPWVELLLLAMACALLAWARSLRTERPLPPATAIPGTA